MRYLFLLLIIVPATEIGILIFSGQTLGVIPTIVLIITTGILGAYLAKKQGIETWQRAQRQLQYGQVPGEEIIDGLCILVGGVVLLTPGFITDALGFFLLLPFTRKWVKPWLRALFNKWIVNRNIIIHKP
ncbi:exlusion protein FxsA [Bacillus coahuilensis m2-6]|uniref:Exlusion protein FxsA n=1 Tax=Bacillus coahuilensis p1.1.43 TaxID=1150625 RepID=A0A147K6R0_9BACI|nr:FxsA family protein [Bacillus coahuilensis]KUP05583.1 exlusion protein FxsA [Bacillus coahuilensis p1.1.43]KUP06657.1 exlusion protein FxsA [Bacillus coahuilensis m2-6]